MRMTNIDDNANRLEISKIQLQQLNERARWYSGRLWQEPLTFIAILAITLGRVVDQNNLILACTFLAFSVFGLLLLIHMSGLANAEHVAVLHLKDVEAELGIASTAERWPRIAALRLAVWGVTLVSFVLGAYLLVAEVGIQEVPSSP